MKKIIRSLVLLLTFGIFVTSCQEDFNHRLQREAREFTESSCPQEVEAGNVLDSMSFNPVTQTYGLYYSVNAENEQVLRASSRLLHLKLLNILVANTDYKEVKEHGVTFKYVYRSKQTSSIVYQTDIKASEYQKELDGNH